jgi:alpha-1,3-mannosyl-glycoprotein beta-1,2-N-acetylglucosaminyltransferase
MKVPSTQTSLFALTREVDVQIGAPALVAELECEDGRFFLFKRLAQERREPSVLSALEWLSTMPDVAAVGFLEKASAQGWEDVAEPLDDGGILVRASALKWLVSNGYRPLYNWFELGAALRHAGWRVCARGEPLLCGTTPAFQRGRELAASQVYDTATEQLLAKGPKIIKRTFLWPCLESFRRFQTRADWGREAGFLVQSALCALRRTRHKLIRATWRECGLDFRFPTAQPSCSTVVLMFTALRPWYLRRALRALHRHWPESELPKLAISQDGSEPTTASMAESLGPEVEHWRFDRSVSIPWKAIWKGHSPYYRIAQHYKFALTRAFQDEQTERVIILEDDIEVGGDFFPYLAKCRALLEEHPDLLAASAWNDHGQYASSPGVIERTDCFPGCGWLINRSNWEILEPDWPDSYWDEWLRQPDVLHGRQFLRPEVSRVRNFGRKGTGSSDFFDRYIAPVKFQAEPIDWSQQQPHLDYSEYRGSLFQAIALSQCLHEPYATLERDSHLAYRNRTEFERYAKQLKILSGFRPHAPRAAFEGIVILRLGQFQLYLVPQALAEELA